MGRSGRTGFYIYYVASTINNNQFNSIENLFRRFYLKSKKFVVIMAKETYVKKLNKCYVLEK